MSKKRDPRLELVCYYELVEKCRPFILAFEDDLLKHDMNNLRDNPPYPYIHITRECGTWLFPLLPADSPNFPEKNERVSYLFGTADREHILKQTTECLTGNTIAETALLVNYFDGKELRTISLSMAISIAKRHMNVVLYDWRDEDNRN